MRTTCPACWPAGVVAAVLAAVLPVAAALAGEPAGPFTGAFGGEPEPDGEPARLYTNEDLERFAYPRERDGADGAGPGPAETGDWQFVLDFLSRQYERIDAERRYELGRSRIEREPVAVAPVSDRLYGARYRYPFVVPQYGNRPHRYHRVAPPRRPALPHGDGKGIHGPGHGRFTHLRGEDAVPGPGSHSPANGTEAGPAKRRPSLDK